MKEWNELQLRFKLDQPVDEAAEDAVERMIEPEEAQRISEAARYALERTAPAWQQEYRTLREQGWPWRIACYIAWASSPRVGRQPATLQELATTVLGLTSPRVIYTWRKRYEGAINEIVTVMQTKELWEHRRDVLDTLTRMAMREDYKSHADRKLYLEMIGAFTPKSELEVSDGGMQGLSDKALRQWSGDLTADREEPTADREEPTGEERADVGE